MALVILVGTACTGDTGATTGTTTTSADPPPRIVQPGAPGETSREVDPSELPPPGRDPYTRADVSFATGMIPHHAQALEMIALVEDRTDHEGIDLLTRRMAADQEDEIALLRRWLDERGEPLPDGHHAHQMPGMLTEAQVEELAGATGARFDRLFLERMIEHHQGALAMVEELIGSGGQDGEIDRLAGHVTSSQEIEIGRMEALLAEIATA